jgi:hypothetical protein
MVRACWWRLIAEEIRTEANELTSVSAEETIVLSLILGLYVQLMCTVSLPILVAGVIIYRTNGFYFPPEGTVFPIFWAIVQISLALLDPGCLRITQPAWLPRVLQISNLAS